MSIQRHYFKICIDKLWSCSISNNLNVSCLQLGSWRITFGTSHPCGMSLKNAVSTFYLPSSSHFISPRELGNHLRSRSGWKLHMGIMWLPRATVPSQGHGVTAWPCCPKQPEMCLPFVTAVPWAPRARHPLMHDLLWWQGTPETSLSGCSGCIFHSGFLRKGKVNEWAHFPLLPPTTLNLWTEFQ